LEGGEFHFGQMPISGEHVSGVIAERKKASLGPPLALFEHTEGDMPGQGNDDKVTDVRMLMTHKGERREVRYAVPIEIEVSGIDPNGAVFHEPTSTRNVSQWGCAFLLSIELKTDDIVSVCVASPDIGKFGPALQSLFQAVRVTHEEDGWLVGGWKIDSGDVQGTDLEKIAKGKEGALLLREVGLQNAGTDRGKMLINEFSESNFYSEQVDRVWSCPRQEPSGRRCMY
jgi:hypothetical protein